MRLPTFQQIDAAVEIVLTQLEDDFAWVCIACTLLAIAGVVAAA